MNSETPKDSVQPPRDDTVAQHDQHDHRDPLDPRGRETPGSLGLELLEQHEDFGDDFGDGHDALGDLDDGLNALMPHERRLSLSEQRQLLAMRRRVNDDDPEEVMEHQTGFRHVLWKLHMEKLAAEAASQKATAAGQMPADTTEGGSATGSTSGGTARDATATDALAEPQAKASGARLDDPANPDKPVYDAVLKSVAALDPTRVPLDRAEQANVAGALTAALTQTPGFREATPNPATISVVVGEHGDRVFAINQQNPGAPNAVYASVGLEQARAQPLEVSTAQVAVAMPAPETKPQPEQTLQTEAPVAPVHAPRTLY